LEGGDVGDGLLAEAVQKPTSAEREDDADGNELRREAEHALLQLRRRLEHRDDETDAERRDDERAGDERDRRERRAPEVEEL
jgi:hypothetical protein